MDGIQQILDESVSAGLPGVSLAVHARGETRCFAAGSADASLGNRLTSGHLGRIASCSKQYLGVVVLQLCEEGRIGLAERAASYLPLEVAQSIENADRATMRQLLNHSSGIYDYYDSAFTGTTISDALQHAFGKKPYFPPGQGYMYSNTNSILLAAAVEQVTGQPYCAEIRRRILTPLGLTETCVDNFETNSSKGWLAKGYDYDIRAGAARLVVGDSVPDGGLPDGGILASARDMAQFLFGLFADKAVLRNSRNAAPPVEASDRELPGFWPPRDTASALLSGASLKEMTVPDPGATAEAGAGLHLFVLRGRGAWGHDGSIAGFQSSMYYYPENEMAIAMWTNGSGGRCEALWAEVWTRVETFLLAAAVGRTT